MAWAAGMFRLGGEGQYWQVRVLDFFCYLVNMKLIISD
jgi:hypothetical protein